MRCRHYCLRYVLSADRMAIQDQVHAVLTKRWICSYLRGHMKNSHRQGPCETISQNAVREEWEETTVDPKRMIILTNAYRDVPYIQARYLLAVCLTPSPNFPTITLNSRSPYRKIHTTVTPSYILVGRTSTHFSSLRPIHV